jgi:hypothetical protein
VGERDSLLALFRMYGRSDDRREGRQAMGLFKFMKEAGAKLFGGGEAKAATPEALKKEVQSHGFDANKVNIAVDGEKVKLSGQAMNPGGG